MPLRNQAGGATMITISDILDIEDRRHTGELSEVLSCPHAKHFNLDNLHTVELQRHGEHIAYLCCGACHTKCHELMPTKETS
jgi:hypothetical protein